MVGAILSRTANYGFAKVRFDMPGWHGVEHDNWTLVDALLASIGSIPGARGLWLNSTDYAIGDRVADPEGGGLYICNVDHTSAASGTFEDDRTANPTYWSLITQVPVDRGDWLTATAYNTQDIVKFDNAYYYCVASHTSTVFANDLAANRWVLIFDLQPAIDAEASAIASAAAAATSETNAATSETNADASEAAAAASASAAAGSASAASGSASSASGSASAASSSASAASGSASAASGSASTASTAATNAGNSATAAAASAAAAAADAALIKVIDRVRAEYTTFFSVDGSTTPAQIIPADDTIPQQTEGVQVVTVSITPKNAANKLIVRAGIVTASVGTSSVMAVFRDATASAIVGDITISSGSGGVYKLFVEKEVTAGSTSSTTFKMRVGPGSAGLNGYNGNTVARLLGGSVTAFIEVEEVKP